MTVSYLSKSCPFKFQLTKVYTCPFTTFLQSAFHLYLSRKKSILCLKSSNSLFILTFPQSLKMRTKILIFKLPQIIQYLKRIIMIYSQLVAKTDRILWTTQYYNIKDATEPLNIRSLQFSSNVAKTSHYFRKATHGAYPQIY